MSTLVHNKKATHDYAIAETFLAGISLQGLEVKSLRNKHGSLDGAYIIFHHSTPFLKGAYIPPYQPANTAKSYDPYRLRKLLLTKHETQRLLDKKTQDRATIIPLRIVINGRRIGIEIALAKRKKKHDKRQDIKKRDHQREAGRVLKEKGL